VKAEADDDMCAYVFNMHNSDVRENRVCKSTNFRTDRPYEGRASKMEMRMREMRG